MATLLPSMLCALSLGCLGGCVTEVTPDRSSGGGGGGKADGPGCRLDDYIDEARITLPEIDSFYRDVMWTDIGARIDLIADLNGDGHEDLIVLPGLQYSAANEEMVIYLTDGTPCLASFAGNMTGVGVTVADRETAGHKDLRVSSTSACESEVRRYAYDPSSRRYLPTDDVDTQRHCP